VKEQAPLDVVDYRAGSGRICCRHSCGPTWTEDRSDRADQPTRRHLPLRGCIPTKALLRDAHLFQEMKKADHTGPFQYGQISCPISRDIQARKDDVVTKSPKVSRLPSEKRTRSPLMKGEAKFDRPPGKDSGARATTLLRQRSKPATSLLGNGIGSSLSSRVTI
jgi:hypothetical protein